uniref:Uncharacterized protein n=1 Tax=Cannabis sativa TaxID=3483 RepID=A0A803QRN6_CANSA
MLKEKEEPYYALSFPFWLPVADCPAMSPRLVPVQAVTQNCEVSNLAPDRKTQSTLSLGMSFFTQVTAQKFILSRDDPRPTSLFPAYTPPSLGSTGDPVPQGSDSMLGYFQGFQPYSWGQRGVQGGGVHARHASF